MSDVIEATVVVIGWMVAGAVIFCVGSVLLLGVVKFATWVWA